MRDILKLLSMPEGKMLEFKREYQFHDFEVLVDNARTHTAQLVNINDLRYAIFICIF